MAKENALQTATAADIELMQKQAEAQFALTPMGQTLKQFEICQRMGQLFSQTSIVPDTYKGNMPNCAVAVDMALRMSLPPLMVMQNLYVVKGNPAWSAKFLIACINGCGRFTPLEYQMSDNIATNADDYGCRCVAYDRNDTKKTNPLYGPWITWKMVKAEGWNSKPGSKWNTMPDMMFRYRAAAFWQRVYAPELSMGMNTAEEYYDAPDRHNPNPVDVTYTEVKSEEPAPVTITDKQLEEAFTDLDKCTSAEEVKQVRAKHKLVYDNDEVFRDAVIDVHSRLTSAPAPQQPENPNA